LGEHTALIDHFVYGWLLADLIIPLREHRCEAIL